MRSSKAAGPAETARSDLSLGALLDGLAVPDAGALGNVLAISAGLLLGTRYAQQGSVVEVVRTAQLKRDDMLVEHRPVDRFLVHHGPDQASPHGPAQWSC
jgi:hypothetical protein